MEPNFTIIAVNADEIARHYDEVVERVLDPDPVFRRVFDLLEGTHEQHFARLKGRYVLTGATKASLTSDAPGAIRNVHNGGATFGTAVPQAHYLTKAPKDPSNGQIRKHNGYLSAVMVLPQRTQKRIAQLIADFVAEPFG